jgi:type VI secretion system secreted protein VgrG
MTTGSQGAGALSLSMSCQDITHVAAIEFIAGEEAISTPYSFDVTFTTTASLTTSNLIGKPITLYIHAGAETLPVNGVIFAVFCGDPMPNGNFVYRVTVRPHLSLLGLNERNQVFGTQNPLKIDGLIDQLLNGSLDTESSVTNPSQPKIDHETHLSSSYPASDFIVQYGESDLNFLSRRCEAAGVFYFFEQTASNDGTASEKVIFADKNVAFVPCKFTDGGSSIDYSNSQSIALASGDTITSFCAVSQVLPQSVYLLDYNYTAATTKLLTSKAQVTKSGVGNVIEYGDNYATVSDGDTLASIRAQEIACQAVVFRGITNAPQLRPGYLFTLTGHNDQSLDNVQYVVTKAKHSAGTPIGYGQDAGAAPQAYTNEFEAIPYDTTYRPQRVTRKPVIGGLVNATVDSSTDGQRADLDASGGYRLRLLYDLSNSAAGKASNSVRKAGPYAGKSDSGLDFPLLKGTEVILGFINGDPDRPIIVGAAPNSSTKDVVTKDNETRNRIKTTSGAYIEIEDGTAPSSNTQKASNFFRAAALGAAASYFRLGSQADQDATSPGNSSASPPTWGTNLTPYLTTPSVSGYSSSQIAGDDSGNDGTPVDSSSTNWNNNGAAQQVYGEKLNASAVGAAADYVDGVLVGTQKNFSANVGGAALTLIGKGATTQVTTNDHTTNVNAGAFTVNAMQGIHMTAGADGNSGDGTTPTNIILEAYGYVKTVSHGSEYVWSKSDSYTLIDANKYQTVKGTYSQLTVGPYIAQYQGTYNSFVAGGRCQMFVGFGIQMSLATDLKIYFPGEIKIAMATDCKLVLGWDFKFVVGGYDMKIVANDIKLVLGNTVENQPNKIDLGIAKMSVSQIWTAMSNIKATKDTIVAKQNEFKADNNGAEIKAGEAYMML